MDPNFSINPFIYCDKLQTLRTKVSHLLRSVSDNSELKQLSENSSDTQFVPLELYCCQPKDVRRKHFFATVSVGEQFAAQRCEPSMACSSAKFDETAVKLIECKSRNRHISDLNIIGFVKPSNVPNDTYHGNRDLSTVVVESCDAITGKIYVRPADSGDVIDIKAMPMVSVSSNQSYNEVITKSSSFKSGSKTKFVSVLFSRHLAALRTESKEQKQLQIKQEKTPKPSNSRDEKIAQTVEKKSGEKSLEDTKQALKQLLKSSSTSKPVSKKRKRRSSSSSSSSSTASSSSSSSSSSSASIELSSSSSSQSSSTSSDSPKKSKSKHKKRKKKSKKSKKKKVKKSISIKETKVTKLKASCSPLIPGIERQFRNVPSFTPSSSFANNNWNNRSYGKWRNSFRPIDRIDRQSLVERQTKRDNDMEEAIRRMSK